MIFRVFKQFFVGYVLVLAIIDAVTKPGVWQDWAIISLCMFIIWVEWIERKRDNHA